MYKRTIWQDHVEGIQEGTDMNAANFNNLEAGTMEANALAAMNAEYQRHVNDIAKNNESFCVSKGGSVNTDIFVDIPSDKTRNTMDYAVASEIVTYTGGYILAVIIKNKQANGFTARLIGDGNANEGSCNFHIWGGMI